MEVLKSKPEVETHWLIGGAGLYKEVMASDALCGRIYLTVVKKQFECDTFLEKVDEARFEAVNDDERLPREEQEENGIKYEYKIYQKKSE